MRFTLRRSVCLLVAFGSISFASGCQTPTTQIEMTGDASGYRTWNFVSRVGDVVAAPSAVDDELERIAAKQIELALTNRGFLRTAENPDVLVYFQLVVREELIEQTVMGAVQHIPSFHDTSSYDVQSARTELERYEIAELVVLMLDPRQRSLVWRGRLTDRYRDEFTPHLDEAVSQLFASVQSRAGERPEAANSATP